jgi:hypothetical protein
MRRSFPRTGKSARRRCQTIAFDHPVPNTSNHPEEAGKKLLLPPVVSGTPVYP